MDGTARRAGERFCEGTVLARNDALCRKLWPRPLQNRHRERSWKGRRDLLHAHARIR